MSADDTEFGRRADPYRRELLALCYRMLGSFHDAEDALQETYLRAWRSYDTWDGRASFRTWMYRIATRACLRALEGAERRPLPTGLGGPTTDPDAPLEPGRLDIPWLQPYPTGDDPAAVVTERASIRLALVAALQLLPPRQRAVLILRDVLGWRAAEVASLLEISPAAVNSLVQRARAQLQAASPAESGIAEPVEAERKELLDRYARAFENADIDGLMEILTHDAVFEMPPMATWFAGREIIARFLAPRMGAAVMIPTEANGQPAFACYENGRAHNLHVLTLTESGVSHIVAFFGDDIFTAFALPLAAVPVRNREAPRPSRL